MIGGIVSRERWQTQDGSNPMTIGPRLPIQVWLRPSRRYEGLAWAAGAGWKWVLDGGAGWWMAGGAAPVLGGARTRVVLGCFSAWLGDRAAAAAAAGWTELIFFPWVGWGRGGEGLVLMDGGAGRRRPTTRRPPRQMPRVGIACNLYALHAAELADCRVESPEQQ